MKKSAKKKRKNPAFEREEFHLPVRSEAEQLEGLSEDLIDAWQKLRRLLTSFGEFSSHTSHRSIMFYRKKCYAFVRPKKSFLELTFFLPEAADSAVLKKVVAVSKTKWGHVMQIQHADQVEWPLDEWLRKAYDFSVA